MKNHLPGVAVNVSEKNIDEISMKKTQSKNEPNGFIMSFMGKILSKTVNLKL